MTNFNLGDRVLFAYNRKRLENNGRKSLDTQICEIVDVPNKLVDCYVIEGRYKDNETLRIMAWEQEFQTSDPEDEKLEAQIKALQDQSYELMKGRNLKWVLKTGCEPMILRGDKTVVFKCGTPFEVQGVLSGLIPTKLYTAFGETGVPEPMYYRIDIKNDFSENALRIQFEHLNKTIWAEIDFTNLRPDFVENQFTSGYRDLIDIERHRCLNDHEFRTRKVKTYNFAGALSKNWYGGSVTLLNKGKTNNIIDYFLKLTI